MFKSYSGDGKQSDIYRDGCHLHEMEPASIHLSIYIRGEGRFGHLSVKSVGVTNLNRFWNGCFLVFYQAGLTMSRY